ncbi:MAG: hypothetical protein KJO52_05305 [Maribacter sp.]|nr:hypothetical protein [Maribacter sp.]MBT8300989.1 hypothetical protein [Maribacter sp.]
MIKFFRRIRYNLMEKGKTGKYVKYAIGEIVLVVIGILIALSINNWNEERSLKKAEVNFYRNTKQQLLDDANNIASELEYNSAYMKQFSYAIKLIRLNDRSKKDSLGKIAANLINYSDFDGQGNIYETMVNSGDVKLLRNPAIIEKIRRLEETYYYLNRMEAIHFDAVMSMIPEIIENVRLSTNKVQDEDYLYGLVFENLFVITHRITFEKDEVYGRIINEIDIIVQLIDNELNQ